MQWMKKDRCRICSEERSVRYCLRRNKELGWKCCNSYRADGKCPEACPYYPKQDRANSLLPMVKADSRTEFLDYLDRYLQSWIYIPIPQLDNMAPNDLCNSAEGKSRLKDWLSGFSFVDNGILFLLDKRLQLELNTPPSDAPSTEDIAADYLDAIIAADWDKAAEYHIINQEHTDDLIEYIVKQLANHPLLKKVRSRAVINSGFTQDLKQAFVHCELNNKENWTLVFANLEGKWQLYMSIWGTLQDYYDQKAQFRNIAAALSQNNEEMLFNLIKVIRDKYPLSADIQYYLGLYYVMVKRPQDARTHFMNAILLEPYWREPSFHLALLYMNQKDFLTSIEWWEKLALRNPQDTDVQNNIGVCYLGLEQKEKARSIWEAALKINPDNEFLKLNLEHIDDEK